VPRLELNLEPTAHSARHALLHMASRWSSHRTTWAGVTPFNYVRQKVSCRFVSLLAANAGGVTDGKGCHNPLVCTIQVRCLLLSGVSRISFWVQIELRLHIYPVGNLSNLLSCPFEIHGILMGLNPFIPPRYTRGGAHLPFIGLQPLGGYTAEICNATSVQCQTYGYLPSRRTSPPIDRHQIILLGAP